MARRRQKKIAVYGPRRHFKRWRIEVRDGATGRKSYYSFASREEADSAVRTFRRKAAETNGPTVGEMIVKYRDYLTEKGNRPTSVRTTCLRLEAWLPLDDVVSKLTPKRIERAYEAQRKRKAVDTHRNELAEVKTFCRWLVKKGKLRSNPALDVEPVGRRNKGKLQLRAGEARTFLDEALRRSQEGDDGAFACAVALVMGLRASEITRRVVRDVDAYSRVLHIEKAKTQAGNRRVEIPDLLWPRFEVRIQGREANAILLHAERSETGYHDKQWVGKQARRLCQELGLPPVCAHGLRGTHATLAQEAGTSSQVVASTLGHRSKRTTEEVYTRAGVVDQQSRKRALKVLTGGCVEG